MKKFVKKLMAIIMAATMAVSTAALSVGTYAAGEESVLSTSTNEISPRYTKYTTVSFSVTNQTSETGSVIATDSTAQVAYWSCTAGAATLEISVNGVYYGKYIIPERSGATITIPINCSKGDTISYRVAPYVDAGYARATGHFTLYY